MKTRTRWHLAYLVTAAIVAAACSPSEPLRIHTVQVGRSLNSDNSVGIHTTRFTPKDTIYLSLLSEEPGYGTITVRWILNGLVVNETSREVSYNGPAATEFRLQNSSGFPPGTYRIDILFNGEPFATRNFRVE